MARDPAARAKALHVPAALGSLSSTWPWSRLDDACVGIFDCPHSTPKLVDTGPLVARSQDIITGVFRAEKAAHVSEDTFLERTSKALPSRGDLLYSREGTYFGIAAEVPDNTRVCLGQRMVLIRPLERTLHFQFLRYWLNSPIMVAHINGFRDGSVAERLNLPTIRALPVALPPLAEQRAIAHVLGTLDDKIELNRRMSENLEAMARALFKSWFVDFDPVRAKAEGRNPVVPDHLAECFPARFIRSELGDIPDGWITKPLGEWVDVLSGGTPSKSESKYWGGQIPWVSPKVMTAIHADEADAYVTEQAIDDGARLAPVASTLVMVRGMGLHEGVRVSQVRHAVTFNQDVKALIGRSIDPVLLLFSLLHAQPLLLERVESSGHGTGKLPSDVLLALPIAMPEAPIQARMCEPLRVVNERIAACRGEFRTLALLRDTLLPKLISGDLRLKGPFTEMVA